MSQQQTQLAVPLELIQAIANYLAARPYAEVAQFIAALQQLQPAGAPVPDISPAKAAE